MFVGKQFSELERDHESVEALLLAHRVSTQPRESLPLLKPSAIGDASQPGTGVPRENTLVVFVRELWPGGQASPRQTFPTAVIALM